MYDSCRSQVSPCMTPAVVNYVGMYDSCRSQVYQCMTPVGVKYVGIYDSCRSQVSPCKTLQLSSMLVYMTSAGVKYLNA